ncbi:MAG: hypothetical protein ABEH47_07240 [Haloferacaceae archaeon]
MTSTLLDATLCLLLVSGAVVTVTTANPVDVSRAPAADASAETLATTTATVNYTLAPGARSANGTGVRFPSTGGPEFCRTARGTLAALVADAVMGRVAVGDRRLTHARDDLARRVRRAVTAAVGGAHTQVVGVWSPYPGAPVRARMAVGERPPPDADVRAAAVVASSGAPATDGHRVRRAATRGYGPLATVVARRTVRTLFPPRAMRFALGADYPVSALVRHRYARAGRLLDAEVTGAVRRGGVRAANDRLTRALAARLERDLRRRYESPEAAAATVDVGRVRIVVRRWSP